MTAGADSPVTIDLNLLPLGQLGSIEGTSTGLTQLGVAITWHVNGTQLDGIIGGDATKVAFTVAKVGTDFVFTLKDNIDNLPSGAGDLDTETLSLAGVFKATDTDGDAVIIDAGASVTIENDVPVNNGDTVGAFAVHEDALNTVGVAVGNSEGGQTFTASITAASIAALVTAGADSPVTIDLNLLPLGQLGSIEGTSTGLTQLGVAITWHVNGTQLDGIIGGDATKVAFTVAKVGTDFVFTLKDNIDNLPSGAGDLDTETLSLAGVFKATDTDGDAVIIDAGASVTIENDIPVNNGVALTTQTVFEDGLANAQSTGIGGGAIVAQYTAAQIASLVSPGADAPVTIQLASAAQLSGDTGLDSKGFQVDWVVVDATHINGVATLDGGRVVFTLVEDPAGTFTFTLQDQVDHLTALGDNNASVTIDIAKAFVAKDSDGDTVPLDSGALVAINNDVPLAVNEITQTLTESHTATTDWLNTPVSNGNAANDWVKVTTINGLVGGDTLKIDWTSPNGGTIFWELRDPNNANAVVESGSASSNAGTLSDVLGALSGSGTYDLYVDFQRNGSSTLNVTNVLVDHALTTSVGGNVTTNDFIGADEPGRVTRIDFTDENGNAAFLLMPNTAGVDSVTANSLLGSLTINEFGVYTYTTDPNAVTNGPSGTDHFVYTLSDFDGDTSPASMDFVINDVQGPSILDVTMITNTNNQVQPVILTFVDQTEPWNAFARLFPLGAQGQQGTFTPDTGFAIDTTHNFSVSLEAASSTTKVLLTDFSIEGVPIFGQATGGGGGTQGLILDDTVAGSDRTAITAVINPDSPPATQPMTLSTDGDAAVNTPVDGGGGIVNYLYGASGSDVLTGSNDVDFLNGGPGSDTLLGNGGNDILVFDPADVGVNSINGGAGTDVLRIDQGALALFNGGATVSDGGLTVADVDLRGNLAIHDIEVLLITDDANGDATKGTRLDIDVADVFNMTAGTNVSATRTLYVDGNEGDVLDIGSGWIDAGVVDGYHNFTHTNFNGSGIDLLLKVENSVAVHT